MLPERLDVPSDRLLRTLQALSQRGQPLRSLLQLFQDACPSLSYSVIYLDILRLHSDKETTSAVGLDALKDVFNGDIGRIVAVDEDEGEVVVRFEDREVRYGLPELDELSLSYATTIHKSQGSEYRCVVIPIYMQHYMLLQRNLLYTAITRGRELAVLVGRKKAIGLAVRQVGSQWRVTTLKERLAWEGSGAPPFAPGLLAPCETA